MADMTVSLTINSRDQINLRNLDMTVVTDVKSYPVRWSVEKQGTGYVYWSVMVVQGTKYDFQYNSTALGDATFSGRQI